MTVLRRVLNHRVSVEQLLEAALWFALPYVTIGLVFAFFQADQVAHLENQWRPLFPAGADILAMVAVAVLWPVLIAAPNLCMR